MVWPNDNPDKKVKAVHLQWVECFSKGQLSENCVFTVETQCNLLYL